MNNLEIEHEKTLLLLKNEGEMTIKELADALNITVEGARFKIMKLDSSGFIKSENRSKGRGRPKQVWSLTSKGHARFPDTHSEMTVKLIDKIRQNLGEEALDSVIQSTGNDNIANYQKTINEKDSLEVKIRKLSEIRSEEGYMAGYEKNSDGSYTLFENHCPICSAAKVCQGFCRAELNTFSKVLGDDVYVERVDHILAGARRCAYQIMKK